MNIQEIKNQYAQEEGYKDWNELDYIVKSGGHLLDSHYEEILIRAQKALQQKTAKSLQKFFITAEMRDLETLLLKEEISYSRMIEIINEKAIAFYSNAINNEENLIR